MTLNIQTFSNQTGAKSFFKAIGHPQAHAQAQALLEKLDTFKSIALYDPDGRAAEFSEIHDLSSIAFESIFVQRYEDLGQSVLGCTTQPIVALPTAPLDCLFVMAFDADRLLSTIHHLIPAGTEVISLDAMRLPDEMLTNQKTYLDPLNFVTNFAFFREEDHLHTRLVTANYWSTYNGGRPVTFWMRLFDEKGEVLTTWTQTQSKPAETVMIDSQEVRKKFNLPAFSGQLFIHVIHGAGHDIVKYALDTYGSDHQQFRALSCTHDANAWPSNLFAGLPAPDEDEDIILWIQNSHPCPIPAGAEGVGLALMGDTTVSWLKEDIPAFGSLPLSVSSLLPKARWPEQIEVYAGHHMVRPRYEGVKKSSGRRRIAHVNVQREDLSPDPTLKNLKSLFWKGFILPAPILPRQRWRTSLLPTPMSTAQSHLPLTAVVHDPEGAEILRHEFGLLNRSGIKDLSLEALLPSAKDFEFGHVEVLYQDPLTQEADGWLHSLFRYEDLETGHRAETSFGAHIFNTVMTYKSEPQSYTNKPPGLSTRLFLRLGPSPLETLCHLIYPASTPWHPMSSTTLMLHNRVGEIIATQEIQIPCCGSLFWTVQEKFGADALKKAGDNAYIIVRDPTCRLFGYHGLSHNKQAFSLDHMFGF